MQNEPELDEIAAAILLGRVNAPEQEIYHTARAVLAAVTPQIEARVTGEIARLREALTPSGDTKAAYMGEFQFNIEYSDEDGGSYWKPHLVPWTTIKEIMAAIRERALNGDYKTGGNDAE